MACHDNQIALLCTNLLEDACRNMVTARQYDAFRRNSGFGRTLLCEFHESLAVADRACVFNRAEQEARSERTR
jgi:hypothetical protein